MSYEDNIPYINEIRRYWEDVGHNSTYSLLKEFTLFLERRDIPLSESEKAIPLFFERSMFVRSKSQCTRYKYLQDLKNFCEYYSGYTPSVEDMEQVQGRKPELLDMGFLDDLKEWVRVKKLKNKGALMSNMPTSSEDESDEEYKKFRERWNLK